MDILNNWLESRLKSDDENNNKNEILVIGDIKDFRNRMNKNYIEFLDYFNENSDKYFITYYGTHLSDYKPHQSIFKVINQYCQTDNPILYFGDIRSFTVVKFIYKYRKNLKIFDFEDVAGKVDTLIRGINRFGFDYVFYKCNCHEITKIKQECPQPVFIQYDHYINHQIFKDHLQIPLQQRKYDVLCYGTTSWGYYPFRKRLFNLLRNNNRNIKVKIIEHPNYGYTLKHNIIKEELSKHINNSKMTVVTPSLFEFFVKKYVEVGLSKSALLGRLPNFLCESEDNEDNETYYKFIEKDSLIHVDETMSDDEILDKIEYYLDIKNEDELMRKIEDSNLICENEFTYEKGLIKFTEILDSICSEYDKNQKLVDNLFEDCCDGRKINQCYVSTGIKSFENKMFNKYGFVEYKNIYEPVFFFGLYNCKDYELIRNHRGLAIIIWGGTDSRMVKEWNLIKLIKFENEEIETENEEFNKFVMNSIYMTPEEIYKAPDKFHGKIKLKTKMVQNIPINFFKFIHQKNIRHISISKDLKKDLENIGIQALPIKLSFCDFKRFRPVKKGDSIYIYTSKYHSDIYGEKYYKEVMKRMKDEKFILCHYNTTQKIEDIYKKCFIGLRLTSHDGNANTVQELGLCGIKCVHNSTYPNALQWINVDHIIDMIKEEKKTIGMMDVEMSKKMEEYIYDDQKWLEVESYKDFGSTLSF